MIRLAANLSTMFREWLPVQRFARAALVGFTAVEMQFPYDTPADDLAAAARSAGIETVLINAPAGELAGGERGLAMAGGARFEASIHLAIDYARRLHCPRIHVLVGNRASGPNDGLAANLRWAADAMAAHGLALMLEALNAHNEPAYALLSLAEADALRADIDRDNVRLMFDAYHATRRGEDAVQALLAVLPVVGHVQISREPDRSEPDDASNAAFLEALDHTPYGGFVGCEYTPRGGTLAGLGWAARHGIAVPAWSLNA